MGRTIFIGDIHGCLKELIELERLLGISTRDVVVALGDYMDRGPDPVGVVRFIRYRRWLAVLGNHDEKHLRWRRNESLRLTSGRPNKIKGFDQIRMAQNEGLNDRDVAWLQSLPVTIRGPGWVAVHGGMEPIPLQDQDPDKQLRMRFLDRTKMKSAPVNDDLSQPPNSVFWAAAWPGPESIVYGHAVHSLKKPMVHDHGQYRCFGLDTGCCFGGRLTALVTQDDLRTWEFVQVQAHAEYAEYKPGLNSVKFAP